MTKQNLRKIAKECRKNIENPLQKELEILSNLKKIDAFENSHIIFSYMNIQTEVHTLQINDFIIKNKTLALPKVYDNIMKFKNISDLKKDTLKGAFNILEPLENLSNADIFDIILVPALAFSKNGHRLGYGAGYYDKFLENKKGIKIGVCYDEQIFEQIPYDNFDITMDFVVTPSSTYRISQHN